MSWSKTCLLLLLQQQRERKRYGGQGPEEQDNTKLASHSEEHTSDV